MAKHFKSKKKLRKSLFLQYGFILLLVYILIRLCIYSLVILEPSSYLEIKTIGNNFYELWKEETINNPIVFLNYTGTSKKTETILPVTSSISKTIYIYNTHQTETYSTKETVLEAAYLLKEELEKENIQVTVEEGNIQEFLTANNYDYRYSYVASRYFIEAALEEHSYDLFIDLHRDATKYENSTVTIDGKKYAKILFVVGKEHDNYQLNYLVAQQIEKKITSEYPELSRGILLQSGKKVNGIYNQDIGSNMILLELGGNENSYEEIQNTIQLIAPLIGEYLYGQEV